MAPSEPSPPTESAGATPVATPSAVPPPLPLDTHPNRGAFRPPSRTSTDPSRLAPEDAYKYISPPRLRPLHEITGLDPTSASAAAAALRPAVASLRAPPAIPPDAAKLEQERKRNLSRRRRRPKIFKKLLWIRSDFPDNYTDATAFLDHLERNPRLRPYDFWPLVADSAVIVQHVCSLVIYVSAYAAIYQDRLSPVAVVTCATIVTILGWILWDIWMGQEEAEIQAAAAPRLIEVDDKSSTSSGGFIPMASTNGHANGHVSAKGGVSGLGKGLGLTLSTANLAAKNHEQGLTTIKHGQSLSKSSFQSISPIDPLSEPFPALGQVMAQKSHIPRSPTTLPPTISHRNQVRLKTFKSALLIYFTLLGLSPILKSLTKSTSSDSIWALATWLLVINVFFFDYGSVYIPQTQQKPAPTTKPSTHPSPIPGHSHAHGHNHNPNRNSAPLPSVQSPATPGGLSATPIKAVSTPPFPSSLSTNAALMASTVLASRLSTTTAVFSLSLFSIQVFGLFPVFRRHLRHKSGDLHAMLTFALILMATAGLSLVLSQSYTHTHGDCGYCFGWWWHVVVRSTVGILVGGSATLFVMGACSWWLIGLQRYKNVVIGPWDPAKPILAGSRGGGRGRGGTE